MLSERPSFWLHHRRLSRVHPHANCGLHNDAVARFSSGKKGKKKTCEKVHFSLRQRQRSGISYFNTSLFKNSASASQRLAKGHLVVKMKTWQQSELERLALFPYQRDPQPVRLSLDLVWKSVSTAEILAGRVKG